MTLRRRIAAGALLSILIVAAFVGAGVWRTRDDPGRVLEVELQTSAGTTAQIYWDDGAGFSEERSSRATLEGAPDNYQIVRLALPNSRMRSLRFDPSDAAAEILIRRMVVRGSSGAQIAELNPQSLVPLNHVASMVRESTVTRITTPPTGSDPAFLVTVACLDGQSSWYALSTVTPLSLTGAVLLLLTLLCGSGWAVLRELLERDVPSAMRSRSRIWCAVLWMLVLFGFTVAAKLYVIHEHPSPVPFLDQWSVEPRLYVPFAEGCLSWEEMLALHNEHRIFFAKVLALALFVGNAQWDPQLQQVTNAFIHAAIAVLLATMLYVTSGRRRLDVAVLTCVVMFAAPFAWENIIFGFQSVFYLFVWFSLLAIWLTLRYAPGTVPWALGWMCGAAALVTAASGVVTIAVLLLATVSNVLWLGLPRWQLAANVLPGLCLLGIGVSTMSPPLAYHEVYRAATLGDAALAFGRNIAWPWIGQPFLALVLWAPLLVLIAGRLACRRREAQAIEWWMYALSLWTILNAAALAYARGAGGVPPSSRYMDFLSLGPIVNLGAIASLLGLMPRTVFKRSVVVAGLVAWTVLLLVGVDRVTRQGFVDFRGVTVWLARYTENLRRFVATDDLSVLTTKRYPEDVPFPDPLFLANTWLRHPYLREALPPEIRRPLLLEPVRTAGEGFVRNGIYPTTPTDSVRAAWGSFSAHQNASQGELESRSADCTKPLLRFEVAGYLTMPSLSLSVIDGGGERPVEPWGAAKETWVPLFVRCRGALHVVAKDENPEFWFAFREPIEYGLGSWIARKLVDQSRSLLLCFGALILVALRVGQAERALLVAPQKQTPPSLEDETRA